MATEILVPPLGTNVDTVTLVSWYKQEGEGVAAGEPLFAVETDKAVLDIEAPSAGILRGVAAAEGDEVAALSPIAWICAEGEELPDAPRPPIPGELAPLPPMLGESGPPVPLAPPESGVGGRKFASPWARTLAAERGIDWSSLHGSGPFGAVVARDIEAAAEQRLPARRSPTPLAARVARDAGVAIGDVTGSGSGGRVTRDDVLGAADAARRADDTVETFGLTGIRGKIADRMLRGARETASVTLTAEVDATAFVDLRKSVVASGLRATYNDLLMQIVARALSEHPRMGATFEGGRAVVRRSIDIALAVDTERGLLAPVVRGVQAMTLAEIAAASAAVVERARNGQATPEDLRGSSFTITNLGMFGIDAFTPIINLPECAILGVGRIKPTAWVVDDAIEVHQIMWLSLTFDHRLVDGGPAARFLQTIVRAIESPVAEDGQ